jgi:nicotinamide riboside kinase
VWQQRYLGHVSPDVAAFSQHAPRALYILTTHEGVEFVQDGVRDGEHVREDMTDMFRAALAAQGTPWIEVDGVDHDRRVRTAIDAIDAVLAGTWRCGPA